ARFLREAGRGHDRAQPLDQPCVLVLSERRDECARRADAELERLPPCRERRMGQPSYHGRPAHLTQTGLREKSHEVALARAGSLRFILDAWIELTSDAPERRERAAFAGVVPHAGRHRATAS